MSFDKFLTKVFGSSNQRFLKSIMPLVDKINSLEPSIKALSDDELRGRSGQFKERLQRAVADVTDKEERKRRERAELDEILPEAFALVREASVRTTGMRHFDVQMIGGIVLHQGKIAEMRTGEGKTLVATLPAYLNALPGKGTQIVTVNEYLAQRDADWMAPIFRFLGLTVGVVRAGIHHPRAAFDHGDEREHELRARYGADETHR